MNGEHRVSDLPTQEFSLSGLERPAEILVDRWGISHIYAKTRHDVFFVQGFNAARDRLWQLDLWRKRGLGLLAADFGPGFLAQDRAARLFLYRGDMAAEWSAYGVADAQAVVEAFAAGLNAFIGLTEEGSSLLPPEFVEMGTRPSRWNASDIVRIRSHAVVRNVSSEVTRAQIAAKSGFDLDRLRQALRPPWTPEIPDGLDCQSIPTDLLDLYRLGTTGVDFGTDRLRATLGDAWRWSKIDDFGAVVSRSLGEGSNNWAVSPGRTATGRPILASDPHRAYSLPSLRYVVHLSGAGIDAIGAGEPLLPGISIGHNGRVAFGATLFPVDQEDIYIYETDEHDPNRYRYGDGWEGMRVYHEKIAVNRASDQEATVKFTRHGPVIHEDAEQRKAYALRSVWFEPGSSAYLGSLAYLGAENLRAFGDAVSHWSVPAVNQVCADRDGNIGWFASAKVPRRPNWDGLLPVPGDGRYEWDGFHVTTDLPSLINPPAGFVVSANEMNLPPGYPYAAQRLGFEWVDGFRASRIREVLNEQSSHSIADSKLLQGDELSILARQVCRLVARIAGRRRSDLEAPLRLLSDWDFRLSRDSAAAALFEVWWSRHLKPAFIKTLTLDLDALRLLMPGDDSSFLDRLENSVAPSDNGVSTLLLRTLVEAFEECHLLLGTKQDEWKWEQLHHGMFRHGLSEVHPYMGARSCDVGPLPIGGASHTVMATEYRISDFRATLGASFRMIVDVGDWDKSVVVNAPGQSGDPLSSHYSDHAAVWQQKGYVPLAYSRDAVERVAECRINLSPRP